MSWQFLLIWDHIRWSGGGGDEEEEKDQDPSEVSGVELFS